MLFVAFDISGTSDAANASFTLPYDCLTAIEQQSILAMNNGLWEAIPAIMQVAAAGNVVVLSRWGFNVWTIGNQKRVIGEFWMRLQI